MKTIREFWKLSGELVTGFVNKLQHNPLLQTKLTFFVVLFLFCALNVASISLTAHFIQEETVNTVLNEWGDVLIERSPAPSVANQAFFNELLNQKSVYLTLISSISVILTLILSYIALGLALGPTRSAVASQKEFISHIAHELRTPLSIAKTNSEVALLQRETVGKGELIDTIKENILEIDHLAGIINNLVSLNTLLDLEPEGYHLYEMNEVVKEVIKKYTTYTKSKSISVSFSETPDLFIWSNRSAMVQMVSNVIGNAVNFTPSKSDIIVRTQKVSGKYIRFEVEDHGIGIPDEELPYIFKPFYRSHKLRHKLGSGSGLGLAIVKELVRLHFGTITIRSKEGAGTTVSIELPILRSKRTRFWRQQNSNSEGEVVHDFSRRGFAIKS